ncbi:MAG: glycosyltransferase [Methanobacteriota archaeon]|nr:MAG: glycosyltransferase [Euryarchaeota archaeon]
MVNVAQILTEVAVERSSSVGRPTVRGKFLYVGQEKFWVRGISYGTFFVDENGEERFTAETVDRDFAQMAANGFNVVRVHMGPPRWLLDAALRNGLRVMVGLNWGEHMAFLDEPGKVEEIEARIRRWIRACAGHSAVFGYSIGNEIPASIVRWHGKRRVEKFIERLYRIAKEEDPDALVTYVNYPSTEYLRLPFLDFVSFNVYLESRRSLEDYLARLHSLSDDRPVLLSEIGLDSLRNGEEKQASMLSGQVRAAFRLGCAGVIVFAWTDEWYHGKFRVEDWAFGLTTRDRTPKPALQAVSQALAESPFPPDLRWPKISVVVSTLNGAATIRDTLVGVEQLDYPDYEVIVVNDGSTDATPQIASEYQVRLITTKNQGLSAARNVGTQAATGEIVAFTDDDAYPEIHWLRFLALAFMEGKYVGVGGPNLAPPNDGWVADAVANAPGGPNPVLLSDTVAEHIPGCNMAFRKDALEAIGGFDRVFRTAGDDVDVCWRLRDRGGLIGYSSAAVVWHHRRKSVRKFWRQQVGYGKAEALLEWKWPCRYSRMGQLSWLGRIYGKGVSVDLSSVGGRVYQGVWGTAPFQSLYESRGSRWSLALAPEWYLMIGLLAGTFALSLGWGASIVFGPALVVAVALPVAHASISAWRAHFVPVNSKRRWSLIGLRIVVLLLHLMQPLARLTGRIRGGLTPWRRRGPKTRPRFRRLHMTYWRDEREAPEETLRKLQTQLVHAGAIARAGGEFDSWDLEVRGGALGRSRLLLAVEEHAPGKQLLRFRIFPVYERSAVILSAVFATISIGAWWSGAWASSLASSVVAGFVVARAIADTGFAGGILHEWLKRFGAA